MGVTAKDDDAPALAVGDEIGPVRIGTVAHGGHWVARHEGRVIFVRHALEGEVVRVRITGLAKRFARGDAIEVLEASPHRVAPPCPIAGVCGGCDFQHVEVAHQRELKRQVVAEQLERLAGWEFTGEVEAADPPGLGWRTRVRYVSDGDAWGMRAHRSHDVVALPAAGCAIARPALARPALARPAPARRAPTPDAASAGRRAAESLADGSTAGESTATELLGVESSDAVTWLAAGQTALVRQDAAGRRFDVRADGFWQVHPAAADTLVAAVVAALAPRPGETAFDLYCGVGLFAGALADRGVAVTGVEGSRDAVTLASANVPQARFRSGSVDRVLARLPDRVDLVVLDPPRAGAGRAVMEQVCARRPRAIAYVACDPAALARDVATAAAQGYRCAGVRAFDLFGMTHHVECVAALLPAEPDALGE